MKGPIYDDLLVPQLSHYLHSMAQKLYIVYCIYTMTGLSALKTVTAAFLNKSIPGILESSQKLFLFEAFKIAIAKG